jgi:flagellin-like protein
MISRRRDNGVSAIVGTVLLLGITLVCFAVLNVIIFSFQSQPSAPYANIVGSFKGDSIVIEHNGGEPLNSDTILILYFPNNYSWINSAGNLLNDMNNDSYWNIGEQILINSDDYPEDVSDSSVTISIIDSVSNYVIMTGVINR